MRLTKQEKETIINFNEGDDIAYIYTCSKSWINHLEKKLGLRSTTIYSYAREYECPKSWVIKPRKPKKLSQEQRQELSQRLLKKSILSKETPTPQVVSGGGSGI